jgi:hypothetical protein
MKKLAIVLGATLMVVGIAGMHLWQELRAQREQNRTEIARVTALESEHSKDLGVAQPASGGLQAATWNHATATQTEQHSAVPATRDQSATRNGNPLRAQMEQLQNNPQFQEMQRIMLRQMLEEEFPDVAKDFHLSKEKAGKLLDLLAKQRMDLVADSMGLQRNGNPDRAAREEQQRRSAERGKAFEAELKALLGDDYAKWDEYEDAASERQQEEYALMAKEDFRHAITADGALLTDPQFEHLNAAIAAEQRRIERESGVLTLRQHMQRLPEFNRRLVDVAAPHLNLQQLDRYRRYLQEQQEMMSDMDEMGALPVDAAVTSSQR